MYRLWGFAHVIYWDTGLVYWVRVIAERAPIKGASDGPRSQHEPSLLHFWQLKSQSYEYFFTIGFPLLIYDGLVAWKNDARTPSLLPSDSLLIALALENNRLGASQLPLHPLFCIVVRFPCFTLCTVGQPLLSSMGQLQSQVIGKVVAPVALLSGIALSSENSVQYSEYRRKLWSRLGRLLLYFLCWAYPSLFHCSVRPVAQLQPTLFM